MSQAPENPTTPAITPSPAPKHRRRVLRRVLMVAGMLVLVVAGFCVWKAKNPKPLAYTLLHVSSHTPHILFNSRSGEDDFSSFQRNQVALVKTRVVLNSALRNKAISSLPLIKAQAEPLEWLKNNIQADFPAPEIFRIFMRGNDPKQITPIVDAVRKAYLDEIVYKEKMLEVLRLNRLSEIVEGYQETLRSKETTLRQLQRNVGAVPPEMTMGTKTLDALEKELFEVESQKRKVQVKLGLAKGKEKEGAATGDQVHYQQELEYLDQLEKAIRKAYELQRKQEASVDTKWIELEIRDQREVTDKLTRQKQAMELEMHAPARVRELEEATVEEQPPWPQSLFTDLREWLGW